MILLNTNRCASLPKLSEILQHSWFSKFQFVKRPTSSPSVKTASSSGSRRTSSSGDSFSSSKTRRSSTPPPSEFSKPASFKEIPVERPAGINTAHRSFIKAGPQKSASNEMPPPVSPQDEPFGCPGMPGGYWPKYAETPTSQPLKRLNPEELKIKYSQVPLRKPVPEKELPLPPVPEKELPLPPIPAKNEASGYPLIPIGYWTKMAKSAQLSPREAPQALGMEQLKLKYPKAFTRKPVKETPHPSAEDYTAAKIGQDKTITADETILKVQSANSNRQIKRKSVNSQANSSSTQPSHVMEEQPFEALPDTNQIEALAGHAKPQHTSLKAQKTQPAEEILPMQEPPSNQYFDMAAKAYSKQEATPPASPRVSKEYTTSATGGPEALSPQQIDVTQQKRVSKMTQTSKATPSNVKKRQSVDTLRPSQDFEAPSNSNQIETLMNQIEAYLNKTPASHRAPHEGFGCPGMPGGFWPDEAFQ
ncbi:MAG: hypothetical protein K0Q50_2533 [Vampirovibrio sp.]|nr:hypothetical protein [Vampirovibrio sp.]